MGWCRLVLVLVLLCCSAAADKTGSDCDNGVQGRGELDLELIFNL